MAEEVSDAPPPSFSLAGTRPAFLTPEDAQFDACLATSFGGFVKEAASELPPEFHADFRECLRGLRSSGCLDRHDITQPMGPGTPLARTRVTRCLIGAPGITYKYLGLRMFALPWAGKLTL